MHFSTCANLILKFEVLKIGVRVGCQLSYCTLPLSREVERERENEGGRKGGREGERDEE